MDRQLEHRDHQGLGPKPARQLSLLLHDLHSPSNVGALFRLADALGIKHIYLSGDSPAPPNRKLRQAARSTERHVSFSQHGHWREVLSRLAAQSYTCLALEISADSVPLNQYCQQPLPSKLCLIPGSENHGLQSELLNACDGAVHIPMCGHNSSMNVSHACAIACYTILSQL
ncbi:MAG: hypothetical protein OIF35_09625 [Cellvibrionaceae bacterium]|nr:hypothetical protein [Cellvibrionaceae bacterium]MCV6626103.1 hypothetical protein [Cellvibrionaceae bacterium]